jgi:hypothetical protein
MRLVWRTGPGKDEAAPQDGRIALDPHVVALLDWQAAEAAQRMQQIIDERRPGRAADREAGS